jgi:crossover junction endodeoxyribonuclease RuvC
MSVVGIDIGEACGWASLERAGDRWHRLGSGVWDLSQGRYEGGGIPFLRLERFLTDLITMVGPTVVGFEEVRSHTRVNPKTKQRFFGVTAAHFYGGGMTTIETVCERLRLPYQGIPVGTIKKRATGKGNANKEAVQAAAEKYWDITCEDDNEADALWCALVVGEQVG